MERKGKRKKEDSDCQSVQAQQSGLSGVLSTQMSLKRWLSGQTNRYSHRHTHTHSHVHEQRETGRKNCFFVTEMKADRKNLCRKERPLWCCTWPCITNSSVLTTSFSVQQKGGTSVIVDIWRLFTWCQSRSYRFDRRSYGSKAGMNRLKSLMEERRWVKWHCYSP